MDSHRGGEGKVAHPEEEALWHPTMSSFDLLKKKVVPLCNKTDDSPNGRHPGSAHPAYQIGRAHV